MKHKLIKPDYLLRSLFNFYSFLSIHSRPWLKFPPIQVFFHFTFLCNLDCDMCFYNISGADKKQHKELTTDEWKEVINQVSPFTLLTFTGGEPLFRKDSFEIFRFLSRKHRFTIITNGTLLSLDRALELVDFSPKYLWRHGLLEVSFSIEGDEILHNSITRRKNSYQQTLNGIRNLISAKKRLGKKYPLTSIRTVILPKNVEHLPSIVDLANELGISRNIFMILDPSEKFLNYYNDKNNAPAHEKNLIPSIPEEKLRNSLLEAEKRAKKYNSDIVYTPAFIPIDEIVAYYSNKLDLNYYKCNFAYSKIAVRATGDVFTCPTFNSGNVKNHKIRNLVHNKKTTAFLKKLHKNEIYPFCIGCCGMEWKGKKK